MLKPILISGQVIERETKRAIPSQLSFYENNKLQKQTVSDIDGNFSLKLSVNTDSLYILIQPINENMGQLKCPDKNVFTIKAPKISTYMKLELQKCIIK